METKHEPPFLFMNAGAIGVSDAQDLMAVTALSHVVIGPFKKLTCSLEEQLPEVSRMVKEAGKSLVVRTNADSLYGHLKLALAVAELSHGATTEIDARLLVPEQVAQILSRVGDVVHDMLWVRVPHFGDPQLRAKLAGMLSVGHIGAIVAGTLPDIKEYRALLPQRIAIIGSIGENSDNARECLRAGCLGVQIDTCSPISLGCISTRLMAKAG